MKLASLLNPTVPYAWQPIGEVLEIPTANGPRLNVLGFLGPTNQLPFLYDRRGGGYGCWSLLHLIR